MNSVIRSAITLSLVAVFSMFLSRSSASNLPASSLMAGQGTVSGTVLDPDGKPASGIHVKLLQPNTAPGALGPKDLAMMPPKGDKVIQDKVTDGSGNFSFTSVPEGTYTVFAESGKMTAREGAKVEKGKTVTLNLKMKAAK